MSLGRSNDFLTDLVCAEVCLHYGPDPGVGFVEAPHYPAHLVCGEVRDKPTTGATLRFQWTHLVPGEASEEHSDQV